MIQIKFPEEDVAIIQYERFHHPHPHVMRKMEVLFLKYLGISHTLICLIAGVSPNTMRAYFKEYISGGIPKIREINFHSPKSLLSSFSSTIESYLESHPPMSISQAVAMIEQLTGIKRGITQTRKFLKSLGFSFRKTGAIPSKALTEEKKNEQRKFLDEKLTPRLESAKKRERLVYFVDAAHFVLGSFLGYLWCKVRIFIPSSSGRSRYNVLSAIDAITHQLITVCNDAYINACSVCELLNKIREVAGKKIPVTLVLDNARYQRCALVAELAAKLDIELLFLPSYSPNLNLIERLWKWVKKDCLNCKYYECFDEFKNAINQSLLKTSQRDKKKEIDSLLTLNFQLFDNAIYNRR
jgi:transposase